MAGNSKSMFQIGTPGRSKSRGETKGPVRTVLGPGCSVEGKLVCTGPTRLDGDVNGALVADEYLVIDRNSKVVADLEVDELIVRGRVQGNITARKRVRLEDSAIVEGDIKTPAIAIDDGAQVLGKVDVTRPKAVKKSTAEIRELKPASERQS